MRIVATIQECPGCLKTYDTKDIPSTVVLTVRTTESGDSGVIEVCHECRDRVSAALPEKVLAPAPKEDPAALVVVR